MAKNDFVDQLKTLNSRLEWWQKTIIVGGAIGVIAGIIMLLSMSASNKEMSVLFSNVDNAEAGKIVAKLKEMKIDYKVTDNGQTILVDKTKVYETRMDLAGQGLPESGTVGFELFDKTNLGMSEFVQKLNYRRALEGELSKTIQSMEQVKKARVHIVIPEKTLFEKDQKVPTASVTLHMKNEKSMQKVDIDGIQNLIASSIEGMSPGDVTIVDNRAKILSVKPNDKKSAAGKTEFQMEQKIKAEEYISQKVQSLLDGVLGQGNSEVRVSAELDFTQIERTTTDFNPERQVVRSEQSIAENSKSVDSLSYPNVSQDRQQQNNISNYEISKTEEKIIQEVGNIKRLTVAALINGTNKILDKNGVKTIQYTPRTEEELQKLNDVVKNAVGFNPTRNDQVSVLSVPFDNSYLENDIKEVKPIDWHKSPENIKLFILIGSILIVMIMIYSILNSRAVKERFRIAYALPEKASIDEEDMNLEQLETERMNELSIDTGDMLLLPTEMTDQWLLSGDKSLLESDSMLTTNSDFDTSGFADRTGNLEKSKYVQLTEESMMKSELKNQIQTYVSEQPQEAVKLIRMLMNQDSDLEKQMNNT